ncbi:MAG: DUF1566 domain-containing protein [Candidatus Erginobacter occultus]|nr:DUF1566 domain-containing protein [Candidatus Erginobacter occultus]
MKRWTSVGVLLLAGVGSAGIFAADFNGDGTSDMAIFRPTSGLWAARGVTRVYFGNTGDNPVAGDYGGSGMDAPAVYRSSSGLWAVRGVTRVYFGGSSDIPVPSGRAALLGLLRTGQTDSVQVGDDGDAQAGLAFNYQTLAPDRNQPDQVVTIDRTTGLIWASDGQGKGCFNGQSSTWSEALVWARNLQFAGYDDWRIPSLQELLSLVDYGRFYPAISSGHFPNTEPQLVEGADNSSGYWSGTTYWYPEGTQAWMISFSSGYIVPREKNNYNYVRAVRGGE